MFGSFIEDTMQHNRAGEMLLSSWNELIDERQYLSVDEFVIMPNHIHAIVWIKKNPVGVEPRFNPSLGSIRRSTPTDETLFEIVQRFKSLTTNKYIQGVKTGIYPEFNKRIWQRNYYERVIRNEGELNNTRLYIQENPKNWDYDKYHK